MDVAEFLEQLDELFELEPGTIQISSVIDQIPRWSSLTFLGLIALIDESYNVALRPRQLYQCSTVDELLSLVAQLQLSPAA